MLNTPPTHTHTHTHHLSQATALSLQQHSRDAEIKVEQAYTRLANGEPPDDESKVHWERMVRDKGRKVNEEIVKRKVQPHIIYMGVLILEQQHKINAPKHCHNM